MRWCSSKPTSWRSLIASGCSDWLPSSDLSLPFSFANSNKAELQGRTGRWRFAVHWRNNMPNAIDTVQEHPQSSSILEVEVPQLFKAPAPKSPFRRPKRKPVPYWALAGLAVMLAPITASSWWLHARRLESTDDAQIDGHINVVSSRISGTVLYVNPRVENNQYVEAGALLL